MKNAINYESQSCAVEKVFRTVLIRSSKKQWPRMEQTCKHFIRGNTCEGKSGRERDGAGRAIRLWCKSDSSEREMDWIEGWVKTTSFAMQCKEVLSLNQSQPALSFLPPSFTGWEQPWEAWPLCKSEDGCQDTTDKNSWVFVGQLHCL